MPIINMVYKKKKTRLPSGYQEVEYIESTRTQKISTGFNVKSTMKVQTDFMITRTASSSDSEVLFGTAYGSRSWASALVFYHTNDGLQTANGDGAKFSPFSLATKHSLEWSPTSATLDGVTKSISAGTSSYEVTLFYGNSTGGYTRIYTFKIYDGTTLERDFVPCYRKSDSVIGLYDLVGKQFYTNSGTGTFNKGADKVDWKPNENTIAYYPLTSTSTVNDMSGNSKTLTNNGVTFGTVGNVSCATLNGSSYLNRSESLFTGSSDFTVNLWWKRTGTYVSHYNIFSIGTANGTNSFVEWIQPTGTNAGHLYVGGWTNDRDTGYSVPENTWLNIVYTHSGGTIKVYVNNDLKYTGTVSFTIASGYTGVGCGIGDAACIIGNLSNIIVENKERTADEISAYFEQTKANYGL